jgi:hypothetical protein
MAFPSMIYHHLQDKGRAISEMARALRHEGCVCLRTATLESLDSYLSVRSFPRANRIEVSRLPSRGSVAECMWTGGFELKCHSVVRRLFAENLREYVNRISLKDISSLRMLEEESSCWAWLISGRTDAPTAERTPSSRTSTCSASYSSRGRRCVTARPVAGTLARIRLSSRTPWTSVA